MAVIIPITAEIPSQRFSITLDDIAYFMIAKWNSRAAFWTLDIQDENEIAIISGITLKKGNDLIEAYNLTLKQPLSIRGSEATLSNIGTDSFLVYGD